MSTIAAKVAAQPPPPLKRQWVIARARAVFFFTSAEDLNQACTRP